MADDVFILNTAGLPYYSKCFGGETCKAHPDHSLQTGFLAALSAFSEETFGQELKTVIFKEMKLNFKVDKENGLIIAFTNPLNTNDKEVEKQLEEVYERFIENFEHILDRGYVETHLYANFEETLKELKIVPHEPMKEIPLRTKHKKSFLRKIFNAVFKK